MTDEPGTEAVPDVPDVPDVPETDWERKRRLAAVFGDVLPDTTTDEREPGSSDGDASEEWLKAQVPPHHGG